MMNSHDLSIDWCTTDIPELRITTNRDIKAGTSVHLWTPCFRLFHGNSIQQFELEGAEPGTLQHIKDDPCTNKKSFREVKATRDIPAGATFTVKIGTSPDRGLNSFADIDLQLQIVAFDEEAYKRNICRFAVEPYSPPFTIITRATEPVRVEAYRRFNNDLHIRLADAKGSTALIKPGTVTATLAALNKCVEISKEGTARIHLETDEPGCLKLVSSTGLSTSVNPLPLTPSGKAVYFGDIHWHTEMSTDGARSLRKSLKTCRDELGLDFAGSSEHALGEGDFGRSDVRDLVDIYREFDAPGSFATIPGLEISRQYGHCNVYMTDFEKLIRFADRFPEEFGPIVRDKMGVFGIEAVAAMVEDEHTLIVPHHTNMDNAAGKGKPGSLPAWTAFHWPRKAVPQYLRLMEMNQQRGSFETEIPDPDWQPPFWKKFRGGLGGSAQTALAKGHRIGFTGGTDNHFGWPTLDGSFGKVGGVTGVIADELTKETIVKALHARQCYATTGARIVAHATLNEAIIGSELRLGLTDPRVFNISIQGTAPLERVELVSFGQVAHTFEVSDQDCDFTSTWEDDRPERAVEDVHYYVRARQVDGHCIWLSPWWIDLNQNP